MIAIPAVLLTLLALPQGTKQAPGPVNADEIKQAIGRLSIMDQNTFALAISRLADIGPAIVPHVAPLVADEGQATQVRNGSLQALARLEGAALPALDSVIRCLAAEHPILRANSLIVIGKIGVKARKAFPAVDALRTDKDPMVRRLALYVATLLTEDQAAFLSEVAKGLKDKEASVRMYAARTLQEVYGPKAAPHLDDLIAAIETPDEHLARAVRLAIASIGEPAVPKLLEMVRGDDAELRLAAVEIFSVIRPVHPKGLDAIIEIIRSGEGKLLDSATLALRRIGAKSAVPLGALVTDASLSKERRMRALKELGTLGDDARGATEVYRATLTDSDPMVRLVSVRSIDKIPAGMPALVPELTKLLDDPSVDIRMAAASAVGRTGPAAKVALPRLQDLLAKGDAVSMRIAGQAIRSMGTHALPIASDIWKSIRTGEERHRMQLIDTMSWIGPAVVPMLLSEMGSAESLRDRRSVVLVLRAIGPRLGSAAPSAVKALVEALSSDEEVLVRDAAFALGRLGSRAQSALPRLMTLAENGSREIRIAALTALSSIDGADPKVFATVTKSLTANVEEVRWAAIEALGVAGNKQAVPSLIKLLDDKDMYARLRAFTALGAIGRSAADAVPAIRKRLQRETDNMVSLEASRALRTILGIDPDR